MLLRDFYLSLLSSFVYFRAMISILFEISDIGKETTTTTTKKRKQSSIWTIVKEISALVLDLHLLLTWKFTLRYFFLWTCDSERVYYYTVSWLLIDAAFLISEFLKVKKCHWEDEFGGTVYIIFAYMYMNMILNT